jgi:hypothetical protein
MLSGFLKKTDISIHESWCFHGALQVLDLANDWMGYQLASLIGSYCEIPM